MFETLNPLFYLYDEEEDNRNYISYFSAEEAFIKGNIIKEEYKGYKNYNPRLPKPLDQRTKKLLYIQMLSNYINDLVLLLSVDPTNKEVLNLFEQTRKKLKEEETSYNAMYPSFLEKDAKITKDGLDYLSLKPCWENE